MFLLFPLNAYADDRSLSNFTKSIVAVYVASKACENTISPGPREYIEVINSYFSQLYPNGGASYWVIPKTDRNIASVHECIRLIERKLSDYRSAYNDYSNNYKNTNAIPVLVAYRWGESYVETPQRRPTSSYLALPKQKFSESFSR